MSGLDWQSALWDVPNQLGGWWTWGWSLVALVAAIMMFLRTVLRSHWNALTFFQSLYTFGLFAIFLVAFNSGWQRWLEPIFAISGLGMAVIYFFNLHRHRNICRSLWYRLSDPFRERMHVDRENTGSTVR